jgi:hypothetical protein
MLTLDNGLPCIFFAQSRKAAKIARTAFLNHGGTEFFCPHRFFKPRRYGVFFARTAFLNHGGTEFFCVHHVSDRKVRKDFRRARNVIL